MVQWKVQWWIWIWVTLKKKGSFAMIPNDDPFWTNFLSWMTHKICVLKNKYHHRIAQNDAFWARLWLCDEECLYGMEAKANDVEECAPVLCMSQNCPISCMFNGRKSKKLYKTPPVPLTVAMLCKWKNVSEKLSAVLSRILTMKVSGSFTRSWVTVSLKSLWRDSLDGIDVWSCLRRSYRLIQKISYVAGLCCTNKTTRSWILIFFALSLLATYMSWHSRS